jgi:hypothetical protein
MKGDFSRHTFRSEKHFNGVLMQQGRLQLDADFNEQQAINQYRFETEATDIIGATGASRQSGGFQIDPTGDGEDLFISPGRIYVDGILCELEQPTPVAAEVQGGNQVLVASWVVDGREFEPNQWIDISDPEKGTQRVQIREVDESQRLLTFNADLPEFVDASAPIVRRITTYDSQPDWFEPLPPEATDGSVKCCLIYLDVWQRHITAIEDPQIQETALGGPDTTTRIKTVWQVRYRPVATNATCDDLGPDWPPQAIGRGQLQASVAQGAGADSPCVLSAAGGYRGLENQLYRVEIHRGGSLAGAPDSRATFKWSRDNGSLATAIANVNVNSQKITVNDVGRDEIRGFATGQWVEIIDDRMELHNHRGQLLQIEAVDRATREITISSETPVPTFDNPRHLKLRRWDQRGAASDVVDGVSLKEGLPVTTGEIVLEGGITLQFSGDAFRPGDYWLIPARTAINGNGGGIEWTHDDANNPLPLPPHGVRHHHCPLALLEIDGSGLRRIEDCRPKFPSLVDVASFFEPGVRILEVTAGPSDQAVPVVNDTELSIDTIARGLQILCSEEIDPESVKPPTCFVTLDLPYPLTSQEQGFWDDAAIGQPIIGFQPLILSANVAVDAVDGMRITWNPADDTQSWLQGKLLQRLTRFGRGTSLLAHLTLKGNFIWAHDNPRLFLDGNAFGAQGPDDTRTDVRLPSGNNQRGGDFEMWFRLVQPKPFSMDLDPTRVTGGKVSQGTITLSSPAPDGGAEIKLSSDDTDVATVDASVTVLGGEHTVTFQVKTKPVAGSTNVKITATYGENQTQIANLVVCPFLKVTSVVALGLKDFRYGQEVVIAEMTDPRKPMMIDLKDRPTALEVTFNSPPFRVSKKTVTVFSFSQHDYVDVRFEFAEPNVIRFELGDLRADFGRGTRTGALGGRSMAGVLGITVPGITAPGITLPEGMPREGMFLGDTLPDGVYRFEFLFLGEGPGAIRSEEGTRLDGEPLGLPSGNDIEGGNFVFEINIVIRR